MKNKGKNITTDSGFWNCLMPTRLIILHISLCFRDGCLSATVTGITMRVSLFLLSAEGMRHGTMFSTALHINKDVALLWKKLWDAHKLHWKYLNSIAEDIWDAKIHPFLIVFFWQRSWTSLFENDLCCLAAGLGGEGGQCYPGWMAVYSAFSFPSQPPWCLVYSQSLS